MADSSHPDLEVLLARANAGDAAAREQLIDHSRVRLLRLTHKLLQGFPGVRRWEDTDDVLQNALMRLLRALRSVSPPTVADYFRLATRQLRRELIDLARHYYGPEGLGANYASQAPGSGSEDRRGPVDDKADSSSSNEPGRLAAWTQFHERVAALPEPEREVFELLWYHGLTQAEVGVVLNVSVPTVKRRWLAARLELQDAMRGEAPGV
jgi:RNA polymerase sigma factor (sigma-70 family)